MLSIIKQKDIHDTRIINLDCIKNIINRNIRDNRKQMLEIIFFL